MWIADGWKEYEVIDCSGGEKLERWGDYLLVRPDPQEIWNNQTINAETARVIEELAYFVWEHFQNPTVPGVNIGQWCKKEDCWELLQSRYEAKMKKREN